MEKIYALCFFSRILVILSKDRVIFNKGLQYRKEKGRCFKAGHEGTWHEKKDIANPDGIMSGDDNDRMRQREGTSGFKEYKVQ